MSLFSQTPKPLRVFPAPTSNRKPNLEMLQTPQATRTRPKKKDKETETDYHRLQQRAKQIQYGKNTQGYQNLCRIANEDPAVLKGCLPATPSIHQKCSKRSWDGQIRKWRRALHMYDYVDFGDSEEMTKLVREKLIEQSVNPIFSPSKERSGVNISLPSPVKKMQYSRDLMFELLQSPLVTDTVKMPETLLWLDKRHDLDEEIEEEVPGLLAATPNRSSLQVNVTGTTP